MASLEQSGLIVRQRGKGTFVSDKSVSFNLPRYTGSIEDLILIGKVTSKHILEQTWIVPPDHIRARLKIGEKEKVLRIQKIRRIEGDSFSHIFNYLPAEIAKRLPLELLEKKPLLMILEDDLGIRPVEAEQSVEATIADPEIAAMLDIRVGDPLLKAERIVYDAKKNPLESSPNPPT